MYLPVYECSLCGEFTHLGEPLDIPQNSLPEFLGKVVQNQLFAGNPYLHKVPMQIPHQCKNGDCGMAYFAGLKKVG